MTCVDYCTDLYFGIGDKLNDDHFHGFKRICKTRLDGNIMVSHLKPIVSFLIVKFVEPNCGASEELHPSPRNLSNHLSNYYPYTKIYR